MPSADRPCDAPPTLHPRPDFERQPWLDLNGEWAFDFDPEERGWEEGWYLPGRRSFERRIRVPFSWAAPLSGVGEEFEGSGWYARELVAPPDWEGRRPFVVFGAVDWECDAWLNGVWLGRHEGGYTPFEFDLSPHWRPDESNYLVVRARDVNARDTLRGKQGYGSVSGIWQPVRLEARGSAWLRRLHFTPDVENGQVRVDASVSSAYEQLATALRSVGGATDGLTLQLQFNDLSVPDAAARVELHGGEGVVSFVARVPEARLWSPEDPYLYTVRARLVDAEGTVLDEVRSYFGMRSVARDRLPGRDFECILLNGKPVYIAGALDQCYHPEGYYTYPTDEDARRDVSG